MKRRDFLKRAAATTAAIGFGGAMHAADNGATPATSLGQLPRRPYQPGIELSVIGFGGIVVVGMPQEEANRHVARAVERGVNYFDVAPSYGKGEAEEKLGPALEPYRKGAFLACKTGERRRDAAEAEFNQSLQRLRTDYFDLYQLHAITGVEKDVDAAFAPGGVMEFLDEAKRDGRVRHLGFSAHSVEAALAAMDRYDFDSILFPVNFACWNVGDFGPQILEAAQKRGVARLALKAMAKQKWPPNTPKDDPRRKPFPKCWYEPLSDPRHASLGLRFTLSQPVTAAIPPGQEELFWLAVDLASDLQPLTEQDRQELAALEQGLDPIFRFA